MTGKNGQEALRVAAFINTENLLKRPETEKLISGLPKYVEVFYDCGDAGKRTAENFFTGAEANYLNYDYVFILNFLPPSAAMDKTFVHLLRQEYVLQNLMGDADRIGKLVNILENSPMEGMLCVPADYMNSLNWELYESWSDCFDAVDLWKRQNALRVPIDKSKPPIMAENGCALVKTSAIKGFEQLEFPQMGSVMCAFLLPLYVQQKGKLPAYIICPQSAANLLAGYEAHADMLPETLKIKAEYYQANRVYVQKVEHNMQELQTVLAETKRGRSADNASSKKWIEKLEKDIVELKNGLTQTEEALFFSIEKNQEQSFSLLEQERELQALKKKNQEQSFSLLEQERELQTLKKEYNGVLQSASWKITAPIRKLFSFRSSK